LVTKSAFLFKTTKVHIPEFLYRLWNCPSLQDKDFNLHSIKLAFNYYVHFCWKITPQYYFSPFLLYYIS
jgi:hypothetical protein